MGLGTLITRAVDQIIEHTWFNTIQSALYEDLVGRNTSGVPEAGKNLGTALYPWGVAHVTSLFLDGSSVSFEDQESDAYKIVSGATRSGSNQPAFLVPSGSGATATLNADPTNLEVEINGEAVTFASDVSITGLTVAPSSQNTALVNSALAVSDMASRMWGESQSFVCETPSIPIDTAGTEITALIGKFAAFKIVQGGNTEYFLAYVASATSLTQVRRGYFYNSSLAPINRIAISDNAVITLMKLAWVYGKSDGTVDINYNNPSITETEPAAPATNDFWYDLTNNVWKQYDGAVWNTVEKIPLGLLVTDATNCVAARSFDFFASIKDFNTVELELKDTATVWPRHTFSTVGVKGTIQRFGIFRPQWAMGTHLASSEDMYSSTEQASRVYFFYLSDRGEKKISDIHPYWRGDLRGYYHPHNPWRCLAAAYNNGSSNLDTLIWSEFNAAAPPTNMAISASSGSFTSSGSTSGGVGTVNVGVDVGIFARYGRRLKCYLGPATSAFAYIGASRASQDCSSAFTLFRSSDSAYTVEVPLVTILIRGRAAGVADVYKWDAPPFLIEDSPGPGLWYYRLRVGCDTTGSSPLSYVQNCVLIIKEEP